MAYIPVAGTVVTVDMTKITGAHATAFWYDAAASVATRIGTFATQGARNFTSPGAALALARRRVPRVQGSGNERRPDGTAAGLIRRSLGPDQEDPRRALITSSSRPPLSDCGGRPRRHGLAHVVELVRVLQTPEELDGAP